MRDSSRTSIPFIDLAAQRRRLGTAVDEAILAVLDHGQYSMGPEVHAVETELAARTGAAHVLSCSSGTDALLMPLMALDIGPGDAVFVPSFTFTSTAEVVALLGATPVFVDVKADSFNMCADSLAAAIPHARSAGLTPRGVIVVDLFGHPADFDALLPVAREADLFVVDDAAQSLGAKYKGTPLGKLGDVTTTSFYPAKPLGCYGDGGAVFTDDADLAERMAQVRVHGMGDNRDDIRRLGLTARFDSIQAAVLHEKLKIFDDECRVRNLVADRFEAGLESLVDVPRVHDGCTSVWAQYTIRTPKRDALAFALKDEGIPTSKFYPVPVHKQGPYRTFPVAPDGLPVTEELAATCLSLPMHPYLEESTQDRIVAAVVSILGAL